jgi:ketosteroid isomerase-like protein
MPELNTSVPVAPRPGPDATPREVWEYACDLLRDGHAERWAEMFAPDGVVEFPFAPDGVQRKMTGRAEIQRVLTPMQLRAIGTVRFLGRESLVFHQSTDPELIICEYDSVKEISATGQRFSQPYVHVVRVRDGEIVEFRDYWTASLAAPAFAATLDEPADEGAGAADGSADQ